VPYDLSARVQPVVDLIRQAALRGERCPTNAEIGARLRMRPGHVSSVITLACEQGLIAAESRRRGRVLRAANSAWCTGQADPTEILQEHTMTAYWTAARIAQLRALWATGHSAQQIAGAMQTTKNAIVGKAHRIGLPGRPSPIKAASTAPKPARSPRRTLPPLAALRATPGSPAACASTKETLDGPPGSNLGAVAAHFSRVRVQPGAVTAGTVEALRRAELAAQTRRANAPRTIEGRSDAMLPKPLALPIGTVVHRKCQWPMWPHTARPGRSPLFCGSAEVVPGRAYCLEHCQKAFTTRATEDLEQRAA
jgi:GcrA cell cycle regulator